MPTTQSAPRRNPNLVILGLDFRRQLNRRRMVVATYASLAIAILSVALARPLGINWLVAMAAPAALVSLFGWWVLNQVAVSYAVDNNSVGGRGSLDERQEMVRNRAFFPSYQIICSLVSLVLLYGVVASAAGGWQLWLPRTMADFNLMFLTFIVVSVTVPHAFIAWSEPDYVADLEAE